MDDRHINFYTCRLPCDIFINSVYKKKLYKKKIKNSNEQNFLHFLIPQTFSSIPITVLLAEFPNSSHNFPFHRHFSLYLIPPWQARNSTTLNKAKNNFFTPEKKTTRENFFSFSIWFYFLHSIFILLPACCPFQIYFIKWLKKNSTKSKLIQTWWRGKNCKKWKNIKRYHAALPMDEKKFY